MPSRRATLLNQVLGQVLDSDGSGSLSTTEFCASIKKLVASRPPLPSAPRSLQTSARLRVLAHPDYFESAYLALLP